MQHLAVRGMRHSEDRRTIYNIMDYGAKGDGVTDDAAAIQAAIDQCSKSGGGTVLVPAGRIFMCSCPFHLASFVELHLEPNSCLLANPDEAAYTLSAFRDNRGEGMMWIYGQDLKRGIHHRNRSHRQRCLLYG